MTDNINYKYIVDYIVKTEKESTGVLKELEEYADERFIPIIQREVKNFLCSILEYKRPFRVLEVGTAIGYSSLLFSEFLLPGGEIYTLEKDEKYALLARENFKKAGKENIIHLVEGSAEETIKTIDKELDIVFLDANKSQYRYYFDTVFPLLKPGGIIICDNILYKGMTANDELLPRKHFAIVKNIRDFMDFLCSHPCLTTSIIPIGDGMTISVKKYDDRIQEENK